jgi:hypothetical protein
LNTISIPPSLKRLVPAALKKVVPEYVKKPVKDLLDLYSTVEKWPYLLGIRSTANLYLPDFLVIGAQKAGTSWIYENLCCHPELYLPETKELHYFDSFFYRSLKSYSLNFESGGLNVKGEITPEYSIIPLRRIRFVRSIMPDLKLIFFMRNPVDRAWSQALMNIVRNPQRNIREVEDSEFFAHFKHSRSVMRGDYLTTLDKWLNQFPPEQMHIGFFEDIVNSPKETLCEIFWYLGVSSDVDWDSFPYNKVVNSNPKIPMPEKYKVFLQDMYRSDIVLLKERFGSRVDSWRF